MCISPRCGYPQDQLVSYKVKVLFNTVKYFDMKQFMFKQDLTLTYQTLLDKLKVHEIAILSNETQGY